MAWGKRRRASSAGTAKRRRTKRGGGFRAAAPSAARASVPRAIAFGAAPAKRGKRYTKRSRDRPFWLKAGVAGWDAFVHKNPVPVPGVLASSTFVESSRSLQVTVSSSPLYLVVSFSFTDIRMWYFTGTAISEITMPNLTNSGAREIRPGRLSVELMNSTQSDHVGGYVRAIHISDPLPIHFDSSSAISAASVTAVADLISQDGRVKQFTGAQAAGKPLRFSCRPNNLQKFVEHGNYGNHVTNQENTEWNLAQLNSGMGTYLMQINAPSQSQTYQVHVVSQDFLRFNEGSMMSNTHKRPPPNPHGFDKAAQALLWSDTLSGFG